LKTPASKTSDVEDNSRLAFLGDAVIGLAVKEWCHRNEYLPDKGALTKKANGIVSDENLATIAHDRELRSWLEVTNEPQEAKGRDTMLAQAVEALAGAMYLDSGVHSFRVVRRYLGLQPIQGDEI
jgi:ribonuclease-3